MPGANEQYAGDLKRDLRGWQIFFIVASVIIGEGIFSGDRQALESAGPGGALLALSLVGILVICVMESVSELVQLFPVPNAIAEYVEAFVDKDLAWCCGVAYWYTWASVFAALNLQLGSYASYWQIESVFMNVIYVVAPIGMIGVNWLGVNTFGIIESISGVIKICIVFGTGIAMYHLHSQRDPSGDVIDDGIDADKGLFNSPGPAVSYSVVLILYSFLGVESVAVTAFEARDIRSLRGPSRCIAWFVLILYAFTFISELLVCSWQESSMPLPYGDLNTTQGAGFNGTLALPVSAARSADMPGLASFINGCLIFCVVSSSDSALNNLVSKNFRRFKNTTPRTHVPALAIVFSAGAFFWIPFLSNITDPEASSFILEFLFDSACCMCLIVWASMCLAFIRFRRWMMLCSEHMEEYSRYNRNYAHNYADRLDSVDEYGASTFLMSLQPGLAWIGLVGSLVVVGVLNTAPLWRGHVVVNGYDHFGGQFAIAWTAPLAFILLLCMKKLWAQWMHHSQSQPRWVHISSDPGGLIQTLVELDCAVPVEEVRLRDQIGDRVRARFPFLNQLDCFRPRHAHAETTSNGIPNGVPNGTPYGIPMRAPLSERRSPSDYTNGTNSVQPQQPYDLGRGRGPRSLTEESDVSEISSVHLRRQNGENNDATCA